MTTGGDSKDPRWPREIHSPSLGGIVRIDEPGFAPEYDLKDDVRLEGHDDAVFIIWVGDDGVTDPALLNEQIETLIHRLTAGFDRFIADAAPVVQRDILDHCEPDDEYTPPTPETLLRSSSLRQIGVNLSTTEDHEITFYDREGLVGHHDIRIEVDREARPRRAQLDG